MRRLDHGQPETLLAGRECLLGTDLVLDVARHRDESPGEPSGALTARPMISAHRYDPSLHRIRPRNLANPPASASSRAAAMTSRSSGLNKSRFETSAISPGSQPKILDADGDTHSFL